MHAIITKFLPATDTHRSRIRATSDNGSITVPYNHVFDTLHCHQSVALALCAKLQLTITGAPIGASLGNGYVFIVDVHLGKTSLLAQAAASAGLPLISLSLPACDDVDLRGLPQIVDGKQAAKESQTTPA